MKLKISPLTAVLSIALLGAPCFAATAATKPAPPSAVAVGPSIADNNTLVKQVNRRLNALPWYGVFDNLQYTISGNDVVLAGQVVDPVMKTNARHAIEGIKGIGHVTDNVEVLPNSQFDWQTRRAEFRAIFSNSNLGRYSQGAVPQIHIVVKNGHVTLVGHVMNNMDKQIAGIVANQVGGVFSVQNNLQVGS